MESVKEEHISREKIILTEDYSLFMENLKKYNKF